MSVSLGAMTLAELASFLVANGAYSTVAEAMAALNIVIVDGLGAAGTAIAISGGPGELVIGAAGETALEVAAQAQLAASGTGVTTAGIGLLQGQTTTGAAALLGMDIGVVAAAAAPLLGVSLGAELYESNPELWTQISQKLLPFCYPGTTQIPTWAEIVDGAWQTSVPKKVIDAIKELFDEVILPDSGHGIVNPTPNVDGPSIGVSVSLGSSLFDDAVITRFTSQSTVYATLATSSILGPGVLLCSLLPFSVYASGRNYGGYIGSNDVTVYEGSRFYYAYSYPHTVSTLPQSGPGNIVEIARNILFGRPIPQYPDGVYRWAGNTPQEIPQSKPSVIGTDPNTGDPITQPMVPIAPPYPITIVPEPQVQPQPQIIPFPWPEPSTYPHTVPWPETMPWPLPQEQPDWWPIEIPYPYQYPVPQPTIDPQISPDPDTVTDPQKQVEPYILPLPIPYTLPAPEPYPQPDPELDPSQPRKPTITIVPDPPIGELVDPIPNGISPWPSLPSTPLAFSQGGGLVTVYHPTPSELYSFEQWLWVTYADATIDKIFNNPFDGVITLFELYCTPTDVGTQTIKSGFLDSGINSAVISRYTEIDCGTLGIPEYYGNYLDYSPYSKAHIYLPFIGVVELNVDDIVGHAVNVTYRIDEYNGSCIAMITVAKVTTVNGEEVEYSNTMYQFSGNCSVEIPLAGGTQAAIKAGMMQADAYQNAANIATGANLIGGLGSLYMGQIGGALVGVGNAASSFGYGAATYLSNMLSGKSTVQKSGTFGASHGAMGIKTPFITITRPKQVQVPNYNELYGYPAHKMVYVGDCTGFLRCREVHVVSATATDEEKTMIERLLKTGVYVTE